MITKSEIEWMQKLSDNILSKEGIHVRKVEDFDELYDFSSFEELKEQIDKGNLVCYSRYDNIHEDIFYPKRILNIGLFQKHSPLIIALIIGVYGAINLGYIYLALIPIYYVSVFISSITKTRNLVLRIVLLLVSIISFYFKLNFLGLSSVYIFINLLFFNGYRKTRSNFIMESSLIDEKIFVLFFYYRKIFLKFENSDIRIYCRNDYK